MSFEERAEDLAANVASLGYDLDGLVATRASSPSTTCGSSAARSRRPANTTSRACSSAWASRWTASAPSGSCSTRSRRCSPASPTRLLLRAELRRLFGWIKDRGLTAIITGERGEGQLTRQGLEEYVSDCVVLLDNRVEDQITTRRLRVVKYRGSAHGTNEYPFLIDHAGISVLPVTSAELDYAMPGGVLSTGIAGLDAMFGPGGFHRGIQHPDLRRAGTGKTMLAASSSTRPAGAASAAWSSPSRRAATRSSATPVRSDGSQAASRQRPAALRGGAAQPVRAGDASRADAPRHRPVPAGHRW